MDKIVQFILSCGFGLLENNQICNQLDKDIKYDRFKYLNLNGEISMAMKHFSH